MIVLDDLLFSNPLTRVSFSLRPRRPANPEHARRDEARRGRDLGQSVAVFGAANGIGKAIAAGFVADGCAVRGFDRDSGADFITAGDATHLDQAGNLIAYLMSYRPVDLPK